MTSLLILLFQPWVPALCQRAQQPERQGAQELPSVCHRVLVPAPRRPRLAPPQVDGREEGGRWRRVLPLRQHVRALLETARLLFGRLAQGEVACCLSGEGVPPQLICNFLVSLFYIHTSCVWRIFLFDNTPLFSIVFLAQTMFSSLSFFFQIGLRFRKKYASERIPKWCNSFLMTITVRDDFFVSLKFVRFWF